MKEILLVTKGHPFEREPFFQIFDEMAGVDWTHVEQPAAQALFNCEEASRFDAFVMYDMPGIQFNPDGEPEFLERRSSPGRGLLRHHALAAAGGSAAGRR